MGPGRRRVLSIFVMLLAQLLQLVLALTVLCILLLLPLARHSVLPQTLQFSQRALGVFAPLLHVLEDYGFDLLAHSEQLAA